ncbi:hypothetical protein KO566_12330 [Flavobacteriaceae bacterium XHP0103]|uniref:hypothetical protein n=1 Tax=Marixanthotalea marina TaxID=2844359 RepID=UPI002989C895|nr:hypothetical protein [Marixanthotalea marina]MBU3822851.1 hypothetical protein [Marixanthotalea marina]
MNIKKVHIVIILVLIVMSLQNSNAYAFQEPNNNRTFDNNFKERYSGNKYNYEGVDIVTESPKDSGDYKDYSNKEPKTRERNDQSAFSINLGPLRWLFYLAIAAAVVFLVYILLNEGGSSLFSSRKHTKLNNHEEITSDNIENADINALINNAENANDYRLAIRYYYLLVLKTLTLKNHIKFEDDKTNAEYLNETNDKPYGKDFAYTSYLYNYIWYGEFPLNTTQYTKAKNNFITLLNQVK